VLHSCLEHDAHAVRQRSLAGARPQAGAQLAAVLVGVLPPGAVKDDHVVGRHAEQDQDDRDVHEREVGEVEHDRVDEVGEAHGAGAEQDAGQGHEQAPREDQDDHQHDRHGNGREEGVAEKLLFEDFVLHHWSEVDRAHLRHVVGAVLRREVIVIEWQHFTVGSGGQEDRRAPQRGEIEAAILTHDVAREQIVKHGVGRVVASTFIGDFWAGVTFGGRLPTTHGQLAAAVKTRARLQHASNFLQQFVVDVLTRRGPGQVGD